MTTGRDPLLPRDQIQLVLKLARRTLRFAWLGAIAFAVGVAVTVVVVTVRPKRYVSQTILYYQEGFQWDLPNEGARRVGQRLRDTVLAWSRLQQAVQDLGLFPHLVQAGRMDEAIEEMRRRTKFSVNDGDTFTIAFVGDSPQDAQRVAATLAQNLIAENARARSQQIDLSKTFLDGQREQTAERLRRKEAELARFVADHPEAAQAGATPGMAMPVPVPVAAPAPAPERPGPAGPTSDRRGELVAAERQASAQLAAARREFETQSGRFTEKHPVVIAAAARLKEAQGAYDRAAEALARVPDPDRDRRVPQRGPAAPAPRRVRGEVLQEHARLTRELAEERERFQALDTKQFGASMAASSFTGGHSAQITVVDPAYLPARPTGTGNTVLLLAGAAASLALGLAVALLRAVADDRVYDRHDLARWGLGPVVAEVSFGRGRGRGRRRAGAAGGPEPGARTLPPAGALSAKDAPLASRAGGTDGALDPRVVLLRDPGSAAAASFRILRHRLAERGRPRCVLVTSAGEREGKTACALNLALALSEGGRARVLLLDANAWDPALGRSLGLAALLAGAPPAGGAAAPPWSAIEHLTPSLAASSLAPGAAGPAGGLPMRLRLDQLANEGYDYIVVDGPPVLGSADVNVLQESASAVLLTAWAGRSRASLLRDAVEQVGPRKVLGVVLMRG